MDNWKKKANISKIYCEKCDTVYDSQEEYDEHFEKHTGGVGCEECPLDTLVQKFVNLFKRKN